MPTITILSSSVRTDRKSHRVALYFKKYIEENYLATSQILDLSEYKFPVFNERLKNLSSPPEQLKEFAEKIKLTDGILIVTPEYNGGYPASLKNAIDVLYEEWKRKPIAIVTASSGAFGGDQVLVALQFVLWKIGAWTVPAMFPVPEVQKAFDEKGNPDDKTAMDKKAEPFINELMWCIKAKQQMTGSAALPQKVNAGKYDR
ncbi:MAG: NAD(P)H-dependent oxidoreductase [Bacteroidia bacterium]|nr:NAD(P)H-dependent oxidoreductase [Bacteroidia bacterium]